MTELPLHIQRAARRYEAITVDGLTLYPVRVAEYDEFLMARPALEVLQQSFPVALMSMPLLSACYRMDLDEIAAGRPSAGLFSRALLGLALSLRLGEGESVEKRVRAFRVVVDREDARKLRELRFTLNGEELCRITPVQYRELRQIMALQNGVKLESDHADPELVRAEKEIAAQSAARLDTGVEHLISSVAALTGAEETEIDDWPILKLQNRADALKRAMDYTICGVAQLQGTKWKGGNPSPHPFFERIPETRAGISDLESFAGGAGARAMENVGRTTT